MHDYIKSSERSVPEQQASIVSNENSHSISDAYEARTVNNDPDYLITEQTASKTLYVFFFQWQSCFCSYSLGSVVAGRYRLQSSES